MKAFLSDQIKKYFKHFHFFYQYLRHRLFISLALSITVGLLDGFGMAFFMPLLSLTAGDQSTDLDNLGNLRFLIDGLRYLNIQLTVTSVLLVMLFFFVTKGVFRFLESYYKMIIGRYFMRKLRFETIDLVSGYTYQSFVKADVGRLISTLSGEVDKIQSASRMYFQVLQAGVMVVVYVVMAFLTNPQFAMVVIVGALLSNLLYTQLYKKTVQSSQTLTKDRHRFQSLINQSIHFFKYLKATGLIQQYSTKLKKIVLSMESEMLRMGRYNNITTSTKEPLIVLVVVVVILIQVNFFSQNLGTIVLSLLFFYRSLTFLLNLQNQWNAFLVNTGSFDNMTSFIAEFKEQQEKSGGETLQGFSTSLVLKDATIGYSGNLVLHNVNLKIFKNQTVAFVGKSGSGKTTLVNVFCGLLPLDSGLFLIDDLPIGSIDAQSLQRRIGYITQEPVVFSDTIYNNVTFWAERSEENIKKFWEALRKASVDDFVKSLKDTENSLLGNNGINISGGQKQRISIARELFKGADILIMDEATSALDTETELAIQENISNMKGHYTILIVAHRLSTVKNADNIVLLNNGVVEQTGSFEFLLNNSKLFERMVELQEL